MKYRIIKYNISPCRVVSGIYPVGKKGKSYEGGKKKQNHFVRPRPNRGAPEPRNFLNDRWQFGHARFVQKPNGRFKLRVNIAVLL